jgi:hypothetical protein
MHSTLLFPLLPNFRFELFHVRTQISIPCSNPSSVQHVLYSKPGFNISSLFGYVLYTLDCVSFKDPRRRLGGGDTGMALANAQ